MIVFPNAKINIGLNILRKRDDGYHELETVFYPLKLQDGLEFIENHTGEVHFSNSGIEIAGKAEDNLVVKAYRMLAADYRLPGIDIHLHKVIPFGAGLGGGSSDAAFMLMGLNDFFSLNIPEQKLLSYAARLGADCAFFIKNTPSFASGIGEKLEPLPLSLSGWHLLLVKPPIEVGTKEAYAGVRPGEPNVGLTEAIRFSVNNWQGNVVNDFEEGIFQRFPEIKTLKEKLRERGAVYASMSGSGSSVFGLFRNEPLWRDSDFPEGSFIWYEVF
ncbi:4-diphosphocytidyl-2-C-methyl-D-erythritol kinase [Prolixibacter bellariivorans]|uniref:4-diphosphocytidyl-2-C-methyl-D-erythritol kinase n=1 Tax=Prolixibacter bellariivorans TaxID=314319 RepID=A0A5M4AWH9_9BACT|nr:4-(cytidine 5'-diphospho)-2-C-methyl-D-erythritol kinase [Prolixibacter bellariivorans]GET32279.1 4-diphosphocytidyl-2-C-methyl-D-erythritol kinase [Prolixibacter bellariivorans]